MGGRSPLCDRHLERVIVRQERCSLRSRCSGPTQARLLSTNRVGVWRNGSARALGAAGPYAVYQGTSRAWIAKRRRGRLLCASRVRPSAAGSVRGFGPTLTESSPPLGPGGCSSSPLKLVHLTQAARVAQRDVRAKRAEVDLERAGLDSGRPGHAESVLCGPPDFERAVERRMGVA